MGLDRRLIERFDWVMLSLTLILTVIGVLTIYSATRPLPGATQPDYYVKQIYWALVGLACMSFMVAVDYTWFKKHAYTMYAVFIVLLLLVLFIGTKGMGAQRWLKLGPIGFQPSEVFKVFFIMAVARYLESINGVLDSRKFLLAMGSLVLAPLVLILIQPDLGTSITVLTIFLAMTLTKGMSRRLIAVSVLFVLISVPFIGNIAWENLKPYQKKRIVTFINPGEGDLSYHVRQSKVAVGSGKFAGKGYMKGTQGPFRFLPEKHTDFVFAIFAEEWGFAGCLLLLALYLALILRTLHIAMTAKDFFGRFVATGIAYMFVMYIFVNIGMTIGLAPVVGIPLPFMSYGGTSLCTNFIAIGLLINIRARRFELFY